MLILLFSSSLLFIVVLCCSLLFFVVLCFWLLFCLFSSAGAVFLFCFLCVRSFSFFCRSYAFMLVGPSFQYCACCFGIRSNSYVPVCFLLLFISFLFFLYACVRVVAFFVIRPFNDNLRMSPYCFSLLPSFLFSVALSLCVFLPTVYFFLSHFSFLVCVVFLSLFHCFIIRYI